VTIERMGRRLAAVQASDVAGFSRLFLRPGLFLPPLMLSKGETEAVLLGLRYVDQRGDGGTDAGSHQRARQNFVCALSRSAVRSDRAYGHHRPERIRFPEGHCAAI
jgi:predicted DNA-binding transcriptional regulator YafY